MSKAEKPQGAGQDQSPQPDKPDKPAKSAKPAKPANLPTTQAFQAEVKQILDLVVHSLYSQKEIFLRELISNAFDASEKRRLAALEDSSLAPEKPYEIWLSVDDKAKTLTISDSGIGMNRGEVEENIGTIAHSGTREFADKIGKLKENPDLIGQFGVGFYSSFMVAEKVSLHTRKAGETEGTLWESSGDGTYSISNKPKDEVGTEITLRLKVLPEPDAEGESPQDFTNTWTLKDVVKKYSDFVAVPIKMMVEKTEPVLDSEGKPIEGKNETKIEEETLNSQNALWRKNASQISKEEYNEFYKSACKDWTEPLDVIHYKAEGAQEFRALVFIPSQVPFDYNQRESKWGPSLYIKKVFIADNVSELLPTYLRFIRGVVDSDDIPLNVSREILQKDHRLQALSKSLLHKVLKHFENMIKKDRTLYEKLWQLWGATIKEGLPTDYTNKEKIEKICLFRTSLDDRLTTLDEYVSRFKPDQKAIYYLTGDSIEHLKVSPHMEKLREKNYEVLLLVDPVDEWVVQGLRSYDGKDVQNVAGADLNLDGTTEDNKDGDGEDKEKDDTKAQDAEKKEHPQTAEFADLLQVIQKSLDEHVREVKLTSRLVDSPVCLVSGTYDPTMRMERLMASFGQSVPKTKRILEVNPQHAVIVKMKGLSAELQKTWSEILYDQALLNEGSPLANPVLYTKKVNDLLSVAP